MLKKAPLHLVKRTPFGPSGPTYTAWSCDARLQSAEFHNRKRPTIKAIVHRSTKEAGKWQTSYFDELGPTGDMQTKTCQEAVRELPPGVWRLRKLSPKR